MEHDLSLKEMQKEWHGTLRAYVIGFTASLILTAVSFLLVITELFPEHLLSYIVIGLALAQAVIQLLFFLHVGQEAKPRWETVVFGFMVMVLVIVAFGSLWIIFDLNERVMTKMELQNTHG